MTITRGLRNARRLTLRQVAEKTKIDTAYLSRAERGLVPLSNRAQQRLSKFYGIPPEALVQK